MALAQERTVRLAITSLPKEFALQTEDPNSQFLILLEVQARRSPPSEAKVWEELHEGYRQTWQKLPRQRKIVKKAVHRLQRNTPRGHTTS